MTEGPVTPRSTFQVDQPGESGGGEVRGAKLCPCCIGMLFRFRKPEPPATTVPRE